jgi:hypothetical protein
MAFARMAVTVDNHAPRSSGGSILLWPNFSGAIPISATNRMLVEVGGDETFHSALVVPAIALGFEST